MASPSVVSSVAVRSPGFVDRVQLRRLPTVFNNSHATSNKSHVAPIFSPFVETLLASCRFAQLVFAICHQGKIKAFTNADT
jgi:hypothetical protein